MSEIEGLNKTLKISIMIKFMTFNPHYNLRVLV